MPLDAASNTVYNTIDYGTGIHMLRKNTLAQ
jgi:hypothetical protein